MEIVNDGSTVSPEEPDRTREAGPIPSSGTGASPAGNHVGNGGPTVFRPGRVRAAGLVVGGYRLDVRIDRDAGNMFGEVWKAQRLDPFQFVAIKFMRPDSVRPDLVHRFARKESTALARMRHPYIATFIDFQFDGDDPYLVMEFVPDAMPIVEFCDRYQLGIQERLELCAKVCEAVDEVHHAGIIHRDLKPQNILVTRVGGKAVPKLIDFGLARSERPDAPLDPNAASIGSSFMGTRLYASPEQHREVPVEQIGRACDIYALGAVLFEVLCGTTPMSHVFVDARLSPSRRKEILEESGRPSLEEALSLMDPERVLAAAKARATTPAGLKAFARSRARHVPATALRLDASARFPSARDLAHDIRACIDGRDFRHAAQESWADRLARSVRRQRVAWSAGALVMLAIVGTAIVSTVMWMRAEEQRARAERTFSFFDEHFLRPSQAEADDPFAPMVDHVRKAVVSLERELGRDPDTAARASVTLARTALSNGDLPLVTEALRRGRDILAEGGWGPELLRAFDADRAAIEAEVARLSGADVDCASTSARIDGLIKAGTVPALREARSLAGSLKDRGTKDCLAAARRAYEAVRNAGERAWTDPLDRLVDRHNLCLLDEREARGEDAKWQPEEAKSVLPSRERLTADCREKLGPSHWQTLASEAEAIRLTWKSGDSSAASDRYRSLVDRLTAPGRHLGWRECDAIANMALVLGESGDRSESARLLGVALAVNRAQRPWHATTEAVARLLVEVLVETGEIEAARSVLHRACMDALAADPPAEALRERRATELADFCRKHPPPPGVDGSRGDDACPCSG